jgi:hypothetical protein
MLAEWSVECSAEDPVLVVPWHDPNSSAAFVDLRANPYDLDAIPEAEQHAPLMHALRALNAQRSPVFTAKCDAWPLDGEEIEQLQLNLDVPRAEASSGFASYIDLIWRERSIFTSFHQQEQMVQRLIRNAAAIDSALAALDCVLRPALVDLDGPREGYAVSLYVKALGADPQSAWGNWAAALEAVVALLRGKDLATAMGNKTRAS